VREQDELIQKELRGLRNAFLRRTLKDPRNLKQLFGFARHAPVGLFLDQAPVEVLYGTDLGNVSQVIPCIHLMIGVGGIAQNHSTEFAVQTDTDEAYRAMLDGASRSPGPPWTRPPTRRKCLPARLTLVARDDQLIAVERLTLESRPAPLPPLPCPSRAPIVPFRGHTKHGNTHELVVLGLSASVSSSWRAPSSCPEASSPSQRAIERLVADDLSIIAPYWDLEGCKQKVRLPICREERTPIA
jgi:hypothetical protein